MRIRTLILCLLCCVASALAKDVITKTDGTKLDVKVEEITETVVKYRKASNPTGPIYTIPLTSVTTILYENGDSDTFNTLISTSSNSTAQSAYPSDEKLIHMAESQVSPRQAGSVSDSELYRIANGLTPTEELYAKAVKYKRIGLIGGGVLFTAGLVSGILTYIDYEESLPPILIGSGVLSATAWVAGFYLKANHYKKQAREMELYSATLIKNEIFNFGDKSLTAGVDLIGNRMTHSHTIGLSLGFNF